MVHVKDDALPNCTYRSAHLYEMILKKTEKLSIKLHDKNTHTLLGTRQSTRTNTLIFSTFFLFVLAAVVTASVSHNICIELQIALRIVYVCVLCAMWWGWTGTKSMHMHCMLQQSICVNCETTTMQSIPNFYSFAFCFTLSLSLCFAHYFILFLSVFYFQVIMFHFMRSCLFHLV